jgi:hypothetical protein
MTRDDLIQTLFRFNVWRELMTFSSIALFFGIALLLSLLLFSLTTQTTVYGLLTSTPQVTANSLSTDYNDSIFSNSAKFAQSNVYSDPIHNFSFTPPPGWKQETPNGQGIAFFTKDSNGTFANFSIDYIRGNPLNDSVFYLPDDTILNVVMDNLFNSSQSTIIQKNMEKYSDGLKFKVISSSQASQDTPIKNEEILFWLKDGRQYYFTLVSDQFGFNINSVDFENAVGTFYVTPVNSNQQSNVQSNVQSNGQAQIPSWIKNNAKWWSEGSVTDDDFIKGIQYLIQNGIMKIPNQQVTSHSSHQIPIWIKNNAGWWANGQISDDDFVKGIQYLITSGIIIT